MNATPRKFATMSFHDPTPEGAAHRREQGEIDADIEGLADDPRATQLMDELRGAGVPIEERIERLAAYFHDVEAERAVAPAAE